jgi:hypothetical protein
MLSQVFKNHWQQANSVIGAGSKKTCSNDDVESVIQNFEQMVTLLVIEEGIEGMPGPIVHFLLEKEVGQIVILFLTKCVFEMGC